MFSFFEAFGADLDTPARLHRPRLVGAGRQRCPLQVGVFAGPIDRVVVGAQQLALAAHTR